MSKWSETDAEQKTLEFICPVLIPHRYFAGGISCLNTSIAGSAVDRLLSAREIAAVEVVVGSV
jgi:hypothetical protein